MLDKLFKDYFCDKLLLLADGFDLHNVISTPNPQARLNLIIIELSEGVLVVSDSNKLQRSRYTFRTSVKKVNAIVNAKSAYNSVCRMTI